MKVPFTKAHGARNDFLLTWQDELPDGADPAALAIAICDRHTGVGADGWLLVSKDASIHLWNSDGSTSEMSGNGTRCAAAFLIEAGRGSDRMTIVTGAGPRHLSLLDRRGHAFTFEMNMGSPRIDELHARVQNQDAVILNVGNPQCAVMVDSFDLDWRSLGAFIERDRRFPNRTNVSFVQRLDEHTIDVRFFERGAGETMSSGTGSTGAAAAAVARGWVQSPVEVRTPAGPLKLRWQDADILLAGPAEIIASGEFYIE
jgi:diaminopimelate epimerase